ncbi:MAG: hypothetical protein ACU85V_16495 [Gammaproteobacteria bacterium]
MSFPLRAGLLSALLALTASVAGLAAQTAEPRRGETMTAADAQTKSPSAGARLDTTGYDEKELKALEAAESLIKKGEKLTRKGEQRLADGRETVREGEKLIEKGNENIRESRERYQSLARRSGSANSPDDVLDEAKRLEQLGEAWEEAIEDVEDGNKLVAKGNKAIEKAQDDMRKGGKLVDSGKEARRKLERAKALREQQEAAARLPGPE